MQPNTKWGFVSKYIFQADINIKIHEFPNADAAWLHCVASHRRPTLSVDWAAEWQDYDILAGKVANDRTNPHDYSIFGRVVWRSRLNACGRTMCVDAHAGKSGKSNLSADICRVGLHFF